jgi:RHS repeat-associated protein
VISSGGVTSTYNGDSVLVQRGATAYTQDLAAGLSQVLNDGSANAVYGHERLVTQQGATRTWYATDALGSVRMTLDGAGAVQGTVGYDPWGTPQGDLLGTFGFTGELQDGDTSVVYLRARWYDPSSGTLTTRDPFAGFPIAPLSLHPYVYVGNNPVNLTDPTGQWWWRPGQALFKSSTQRFQNQNIHVRIQALAMAGLEQQIHAEYAGAGLKIDLLDSVSGEIWEIKPWDDADKGAFQMWARVDAMNLAREQGILSGIDPHGLPYDWNEHPLRWEPGRTFPPGEHYIGVATDGAWMWDIYAAQTEPGLILWWKHNQRRDVQVPHLILLPRNVFWNERNIRPNWRPQQAPAYAQPSASDIATVGLYCAAAVVATGVTVVVVVNPVPGDEIILPLVWGPLVAAQ